MSTQFKVKIPSRFCNLEASQLKDLPTLCVGQASNLVIEDGDWRVWLCRCGVDDGMLYDNAIEIEHFDGRRWEQVLSYKG